MMKSSEEGDRLLTVREAADRLSVGTTKLYQLMDCGVITKIKIDRATRVRLSDVERFIRVGAVTPN